jgi:predicted nucleic acid-binding protein
VRNALLDAGPLIALFSPGDRHRRHYEDLMAGFATEGLRLLTTWPCIVEASHLLDPPRNFEMLQWIQMRGAEVHPFDASHLDDMLGWMRRYTEPGKREMDLADASLYRLACETGITDVMTTDHNDFARYRLPDGRSFGIL